MVPPVYESQSLSFTSSDISEQGLISSVQSLNNWMAQKQQGYLFQDDFQQLENPNIDHNKKNKSGVLQNLYRKSDLYRPSSNMKQLKEQHNKARSRSKHKQEEQQQQYQEQYQLQQQYQQQLPQQNGKIIQQQVGQQHPQPHQYQQPQSDRGNMRKSLSYNSLLFNDKMEEFKRETFKDPVKDTARSQQQLPFQQSNSQDHVRDGVFNFAPQKIRPNGVFRKKSKSQKEKFSTTYEQASQQPSFQTQQPSYQTQQPSYQSQPHQQQHQKQQQQEQKQQQKNILNSKPISLLGSTQGQSFKQQIDNFSQDNLDNVVRAMSEIDLQRSKLMQGQLPINDTLLPFAALAILILALMGLCVSIT